MVLVLPIFFLFAIYGVVAVYLPIVLTDLGYTATQVGLLLGVFEGAGVVLPLLVSPGIERSGRYGLPLILMGLLMIVLPPPLVGVTGFGLTALFLSIYSLGYKGAVPLSDSLIQRLLGQRANDYGKIRVAGSVGYVIMALLLQFFLPSGTARQYMGWMVASAALFILSLLFVPGIFSRNGRPTADSVAGDSLGGEGLPPKTGKEVASGAAVGRESLRTGGRRESLRSALAQFPPVFWMGLALLFLGFFGLTPPTKMFSLYTTEFLHTNATGALGALSAGSEIPFMFFSGRFLHRYGSLKLLVFCTAMVAVRLLLYVIFPNMAGAVLGQMLNSVTYGLYHPAAVVFVAQYAPRSKLMVSMSLYSIFAVGLASVLGSSLGGWMIDRLGFPALFTLFSLFPLIGVMVYFFVRKRI